MVAILPQLSGDTCLSLDYRRRFRTSGFGTAADWWSARFRLAGSAITTD